jgi:cysteine desulfurase
LEGVAVSTGSACSSGTLEPSHVLRAMGFPPHRTQNSLRFSLGVFSTQEEVDRVVEILPRLVEKLRGLTRKTSHEDTKNTKAHEASTVQKASS